MTQTTRATATRAGAKEWIGLAVLALPTLLLALDITVLHLGVPRLSEDLRPTSMQLLWIIDIYGFMIAGFLVTMGSLGDRIGRRRLLLIGAAAFGAASAAAAFSTTPEMLIASRAVMGIAGATLMPSTLALISSMFRDPHQRGLAIGIWATMFSAGIALGPIVGGALLEHFWWGSVFLLGLPVMLLLLVTAPLLLPEYRDRAAGLPDLLSVGLIIVAMLTLTFGIKETAVHGIGPLAAASAGVGLILGILFVRRQNRLSDPLLDLRLFANPAVRAGLIALLISTLAIGGIYLFLTQHLQLVAGHPPLVTGVLLLPGAAALIIASVVAPILARRIRPVLIVAVALAVSAVGFVILARASVDEDTVLVLIGFAVAYAGIGPVTALATELVVGSAPPERAGSASALSETSTEIGVSLGIAVMGSVGVAIYRAGIPRGTDAEGTVAAHESASETLATALQVSDGLPPTQGDALRALATDAFAAGFEASAWLGAALLVAASAVTLTALRRTRAE
ncbi:MFS transporter [Microbacterium sp. MYb62]|uniref:MFS transporter n=1 Tax=Microbacterium sp. MYb62 TaxID=1848690 RepID=UPI000CFC3927|nr:MFS transporter [Microbacterium sp. MYb62]PRB10100.1 MFS transporter [Microbacterium sp. MYb62]